MGIVAITRHGKYLREGNDGHLTKEGICEIKASASALKEQFQEIKVQSVQIFHSPLIRSKETAILFGSTFGSYEMIEDSRITDPKMDLEIHFAMARSPICNPKNLATGQVYAFMRQPEGFEIYEKVAERFSDFIGDLVGRICSFDNKKGIIVVTHAPTPDYLLLQHFNTGLCEGKDLRHGEILKIYKIDNSFCLDFRQKKVSNIEAWGLIYNHRNFLAEKEKRISLF